jgi:hypothetical protein
MSTLKTRMERIALRLAAVAAAPAATTTSTPDGCTPTPEQRRTLGAILDTLVRPSHSTSPDPVLMESGMEFVERWLLLIPPESAAELLDLLTVWEAQSRVVGPHRSPFSHLSPAERAANLDRWATSPSATAQAAFGALKTLCMLAWWSRPETWQTIGYSLKTGKPGAPIAPNPEDGHE